MKVEPGAACSYCGRPATEMDHIIPRSQGGADDPENLAPACHQCNTEKRNRTPEEWTNRWYTKVDGNTLPSGDARSRTILVIDNAVHIYERRDGSEVMAIVRSGSAGCSLTAIKEDDMPSSQLLRQAVEMAKEIRHTEGKRVGSSPAALEVLVKIRDAFTARAKEQDEHTTA